jgi:pilus assembly protein Flp/PilA
VRPPPIGGQPSAERYAPKGQFPYAISGASVADRPFARGHRIVSLVRVESTVSAHRPNGGSTPVPVEGSMLKYIVKFQTKDEEGATAVEYGLMIALIAAVILVTVGLLGQQINTAFNNVLQAIQAAL